MSRMSIVIMDGSDACRSCKHIFRDVFLLTNCIRVKAQECRNKCEQFIVRARKNRCFRAYNHIIVCSVYRYATVPSLPLLRSGNMAGNTAVLISVRVGRNAKSRDMYVNGRV